MPTYIALLRWTEKGIENVRDSPSRLDQAKAALKELGGEFKDFYMTMGAYDMVAVCEAPDAATIAKFVLALTSHGSIRSESLLAFSEDEYREIIGTLPVPPP